ncbi:hypothetical protein BH10ACI1_BH10ACI1_19100 [soil metagenome]
MTFAGITKMKKTIFLYGLAAIIFISCNNNRLLPEKDLAKVTEIPSDTLISIDASETLGQWYSLVISANGEVVFTPTKYNGYGKPNVPQGEPIKSRISREQLEEIIREVENQNFFSLDETYKMDENGCEGRVMDAGLRNISIVINQRKKKVNWKGCQKNGDNFPPQFFSIFNKILEITETRRWTN